MKTIIAFFAAALLTVGVTQAQNPIPSGTKFINTGLGFSNHGVPVYFGMDFGIGNDISLGFDVNHRFNYDDGAWGASAVANYHFNRLLNIPSSFDFYGGFNIGANTGNSDTGLNVGLQVGGRYFITNKFGLNLQIGGGNNFSDGKFGVTFVL